MGNGATALGRRLQQQPDKKEQKEGLQQLDADSCARLDDGGNG